MTGYCNESQYNAINSILGQYAYVAASVCEQANVSTQSPESAVMQWTIGSLLTAQSDLASSTAQVKEHVKELEYGLDVSFVLLEAFGVFCMQTGFALFAAGVVRAKSVSSILLKSFIDTGISAICFYLVGYAFAFGDRQPTNGFIGNWDFALSEMSSSPPPNPYQFFLWNWVFCAASTTILSGAVAERATLLSYCLYAIFYSSWVYPVVAHWNWAPAGWLSPFNPDPLMGVGSIDFAGSGVVHTIGGVSAVVAAIFLGPRVGRYDSDSLIKDYKFGHNPPLYMLGTFMLWFGWYGFNPGSNLAIGTYIQATVVSRTAVTTTLAAAAGSIAALLSVYWRTRTWDMLSTCSGALAGLVAITAGCSVVEPWAAIICGGFAGLTVMWGDDLLEHCQIDDPACAFVIHGLSGIWGVMFVGLLANGVYINQVYSTAASSARQGLFYGGHGQLLLCQFISVVVIIAWATFWMSLFFGFLNWLDILRVSLSDEAVGLDVAAMNEGRAPSTQFLRSEHKTAMPNGHDFNKAVRVTDFFKTASVGGSQRGGGGGTSQHGKSGGSIFGGSQHNSNHGVERVVNALQHSPSKEMPLLPRTSDSSQVFDESGCGLSPGASRHGPYSGGNNIINDLSVLGGIGAAAAASSPPRATLVKVSSSPLLPQPQGLKQTEASAVAESGEGGVSNGGGGGGSSRGSAGEPLGEIQAVKMSAERV